MKKLTLIAALSVVGFSFAGCATMFSDVAITQAIEQRKIYVGMPGDELIAIVGRKPNTILDELRSSVDSSGETVVWIPSAKEGTLMNSYMFTFKNGRLVTWQKR